MAKFIPKILNRVTVPFIKLAPNQAVYVKIEKPLFQGKQIDPKKDPATLVQAYEYQRKELVQFIAGIVLQNELTAAYPNDSYVGKCFEIVFHKSVKPNSNGQLTNLYNITEIAEPDESDFADYVAPDVTEQTTVDAETGEIIPAGTVKTAEVPQAAKTGGKKK